MEPLRKLHKKKTTTTQLEFKLSRSGSQNISERKTRGAVIGGCNSNWISKQMQPDGKLFSSFFPLLLSLLLFFLLLLFLCFCFCCFCAFTASFDIIYRGSGGTSSDRTTSVAAGVSNGQLKLNLQTYCSRRARELR